MKNFPHLTALTLTVCCTIFSQTQAEAGFVSSMDNDISFPGYYSSQYPNDEYGTPKVESISVQWNDATGFLENVSLTLHDSDLIQDFDSLYINADYNAGDSNLQGWDYFVHSGGQAHVNDTNGLLPGDGLYSVTSSYDYTTNKSGGRVNQPNGIDAGDLSFISDLTRSHNNYTISYDFKNVEIYVGGTFAIAYSPWCANDNIFITGNQAPVPEPATMLLFGTGLAGLAGSAASKREKRCSLKK